jgi:hypothetical protein
VILSLVSVCSIGRRLLTPIVAERWGGKPIIAAALLIQGLTVPVLWWAHEAWTFHIPSNLVVDSCLRRMRGSFPRDFPWIHGRRSSYQP